MLSNLSNTCETIQTHLTVCEVVLSNIKKSLEHCSPITRKDVVRFVASCYFENKKVAREV